MRAFACASDRVCAVSAVAKYPGAIALTWIPDGPSSSAYARVNPTTPALLAAYAGDWRPPRKENREAMLTILPDPCGMKTRAARSEERRVGKGWRWRGWSEDAQTA